MKKSNSLNLSELLTSKVAVFTAIDLCKEVHSCKLGYGFIARSNPTFRAAKTTANEWEMAFGQMMPKIVKITKVTNARAYDYAKKINNTLGGDGDFKSDKMSGYEWIVPHIIKRAIKDGSLQMCVTFTKNDKTRFESFYIVGDHFATETELEFIKSHLYVAPNKSVKQSDMGLSDDEIVMVRNYKFDNLIAVGKSNEISELWVSLIQ